MERLTLNDASGACALGLLATHSLPSQHALPCIVILSNAPLQWQAVTVRRENSNALGAGFRCGFLGLLHMDVRTRSLFSSPLDCWRLLTLAVSGTARWPRSAWFTRRPAELPSCTGPLTPQVFRQRLEQEHGASVIVTAPTVPSRVALPGGQILELQNPAEFPQNVKIAAGEWSGMRGEGRVWR